MPHTNLPLPLEWSAASRSLKGETRSGDACLVRAFPGGVLVAVVDGLGHGSEAAFAARQAIATLEEFAHEPVVELVNRCHESLLRTRGAVMTFASLELHTHTMTWLGVGNVECVLLRADVAAAPARVSPPLRGGVVGYRLPPLRSSSISIAPGDLLLLATDGISANFAEAVRVSDSPRSIAESILATCGQDSDDALVLVARYLGGAP